MLKDDIKAKLVDARGALSAAGIVHLAVFGSRARGEERHDSDLDILIDVMPGRKFSLFDLVGVEQTVSSTTGLRTHAVMRRSLDKRFKKRIEPDLVEIF